MGGLHLANQKDRMNELWIQRRSFHEKQTREENPQYLEIELIDRVLYTDGVFGE